MLRLRSVVLFGLKRHIISFPRCSLGNELSVDSCNGGKVEWFKVKGLNV